MNRPFSNNDIDSAIADSSRFPYKGFYIFLVAVLSVLSLLKLSIQTDVFPYGSWKVFVDIGVTSLTLGVLLLAWLPFLIPWIVRLVPHFRKLLTGLRDIGIQEIETGIVKIKLGNQVVDKAAQAYDQKVLSKKPAAVQGRSIIEISRSYQEAQAVLDSDLRPNMSDALKSISELSAYYDRVRDSMPSGYARTRLMTDIASTIWALMASVDAFPVATFIRSNSGGERLAAYKYIEWKSSRSHIAHLTGRAVGVLETPFGQYHALLALRKIVLDEALDDQTRELTARMLTWGQKLELYGDDRQTLVRVILALLEDQERRIGPSSQRR